MAATTMFAVKVRYVASSSKRWLSAWACSELEGVMPINLFNNAIWQHQKWDRRPEVYWDAVLKTRIHLAAHHSYERRFEQLMAILA